MDHREFSHTSTKDPLYSRHSADIAQWKLKPWDPLADPIPGALLSEKSKPPPPIPFLYSRHLDSALETTKLSFYYTHPQSIPTAYPGLTQECFRPWSNGFCSGKPVLSWIYHSLLKLHQTSDWFQQAPSKRLIKIVRASIQLQLDIIPSQLKFSRLTNLNKRLAVLEKSAEFGQACNKKTTLLVLHRQLSLGGQCLNGMFTAPAFGAWKFYRDLVILTDFPGGPLAVPFEHLLSILDKLESEFSLSLYVLSAGVSWDKEGTGFSQLTTTIYKICEEQYEKFGNLTVDLYKSLCTLAQGAILDGDSPGLADTDFLYRSLADIKTDSPEIFPAALQISGIFLDYIEAHGRLGIYHVLEQYGQEKKHYYPLVDTQGGLLKMYRVGTAHRIVDREAVAEAVGMATVTYFHSYRLHEGVLPPAYLTRTTDPALLDLYRSGVIPTFEECLKIPLKTWGQLRFRPHQEFNYIESELELLDDKSVSPRTSKIYQCYSYDAVRAVGERKPLVADQTRLVMTMLEQEEVSVKSYYETTETAGEIPYEWRLAQLKAKERELKRDPRAYTILHPNVRHMASVAERNIGDMIFKYYEQQSMTLSGVELKEKVDELTKHLGPDNQHWVAMILDLFQWNYTFRADLQLPFASLFDDIFGVSHFSTNQYIFRDAILVSADSFAPPGLDEKFAGWVQHSGGNQGIFQKFWTFITLVLIKKCMITLGLDHSMTGAGDNQVILFDTEGHGQPGITTRRVVDALAVEFSRVGLELKPDETWFSPKLFNYHRRFYYQGAPVGIGLKQITRAFAEGSDGSIGINNVISTAMNTGIAVSSSCCDPLIGPIMAYFEAYINMLFDPRWEDFTRMSDVTLALLSCGCTEGGLLPFVQLHGFFYSGHGDHLTVSLSIFRRLWDMHPDLRSSIKSLIRLQKGSLSPETLLSISLDPFTLPGTSLGSPESFIRSEIESYLRSSPNIRNRRLKDFLRLLNPKVRLRLAEYIGRIKPLNTTLMHALLQNSIIGQCYETLNRFTKLSTLSRQAEYDKKHKDGQMDDKEDSGTFSQRIETMSRSMIRRLLKLSRPRVVLHTDFFKDILGVNFLGQEVPGPNTLYHLPQSGYTHFCKLNDLPLSCTLSLRLYITSAAIGCLPSKIEGPYTPSPFEQLEIGGAFSQINSGECLSLLEVIQEGESERDFHTTRGPFVPYRGGSTKDSVAGMTLVTLKNQSAGDNIRTLLKLRKWLEELGNDGPLLDFVETILSARVPTIMDELIRAQPPRVGGSFTHRYHSDIEDKGSFLVSASNVPSHVRVSSNYMFFYADPTHDWNIFYQVDQNFTLYVAALSVPQHLQVAIRVRRECCTVELIDPEFFLDASQLPPLETPPSTFALTPEAERRLVSSVTHSASFDLTELPEGVGPLEAVASYLGHQVATQWGFTEGGLASSNRRVAFASRFTITYNVGLLRLVPLSVLLSHIGGALALGNMLHCGRRIPVFLARLADLLVPRVLAIDNGPFKRFLISLAEAGRSADLVAYAGGAVRYYIKDVHQMLFKPLFQGIYRALTEGTIATRRLVLLVAQRKSTASLLFAHHFMRNNSETYRKLTAAGVDRTVRYYLTHPKMRSEFLVACVTPDPDSILALARAQWDDVPILTAPALSGSCNPIPGYSSPLAIDLRSNIKYKTVLIPERGDPPAYAESLNSLTRFGSPITGARYKLLEILTMLRLDLSPAEHIFCLGDGGGGISGLLLHLAPECTLVFNTLLPPNEVSGSLLGHYKPPGVLCAHGHHDRVVDVSISSEAYGDLAHPSTWDTLRDHRPDESAPISLLTWDAESLAVIPQHAWTQLIEFVTEQPPEVCIIKLYLGDQLSSSENIVQQLSKNYKTAAIIKPTFSGYYSSEVYLALQDPHPLGDAHCSDFLLHMHSRLEQRFTVDDPLELGLMLKTQLDWRRTVSLCPDSHSTVTPWGGIHPSSSTEYLIWCTRILIAAVEGYVDPTALMGVGEQHMIFGGTRGADQLWGEIDQVICSLYLAIQSNVESYEESVGKGPGASQTFRAKSILRLMKRVHSINSEMRAHPIKLEMIGLFLSEYPRPYSTDFWLLLQVFYTFSLEVPLLKKRTEIEVTQLEHEPVTYLGCYLRGINRLESVWSGITEYLLVSELVRWLAENWLRAKVYISYAYPLKSSLLELIGLHGIASTPGGELVTVGRDTSVPDTVGEDSKGVYWIAIGEVTGLNTENRCRFLKRLVRHQSTTRTIVSLFQLKAPVRDREEDMYDLAERARTSHFEY